MDAHLVKKIRALYCNPHKNLEAISAKMKTAIKGINHWQLKHLKISRTNQPNPKNPSPTKSTIKTKKMYPPKKSNKITLKILT